MNIKIVPPQPSKVYRNSLPVGTIFRYVGESQIYMVGKMCGGGPADINLSYAMLDWGMVFPGGSTSNLLVEIIGTLEITQ